MLVLVLRSLEKYRTHAEGGRISRTAMEDKGGSNQIAQCIERA